MYWQYGSTPYYISYNIQPWHCNAFKAIHGGYGDGTYDQNWIIGVYTPDLCFELIAYRSDTWATLYKTGFTVRGNGYMAHSTDGTPGNMKPTDNHPRYRFILNDGRGTDGAYSQFSYDLLQVLSNLI